MTWLLIPMIFVLSVAIVVALKFLSESHSFLAPVAALLLSIPLIPFWIVMWITTPIWQYSRCPSCDKRKLVLWRAIASNPRPTPALYKCLACGARFSRLFNGEWHDASGAEFDDRFASNPFG